MPSEVTAKSLIPKSMPTCSFVGNNAKRYVLYIVFNFGVKIILKCHLILVCKYRKKLLVGDLDNDMKSIVLSITSKSDFEIEVFESDIDHIHFLIRYIPRLSVT